ncbi:MFS transporter [Mycoplasmoides pirum]|uniref:MFS transporter n=1 Tax=Mycoplasmoides pirum TaxID=2122 RepID=UPI0004813D37|nr:MFS transporter [Mycoplasmoides pirum]
MNYEEKIGQKIFFDPSRISSSEQIVLSKQSIKKRKLWLSLIIIGGFLLQMLPYAIVQNLLPTLSSILFIKWIDNSAFLANLIISVGMIVAALVSPFLANWINKSKYSKWIMILGVSISSIGFMLFGLGSVITNNGLDNSTSTISITLIILLVLSMATQIGTIIFSTLGINYLVSKWFPQSKKGITLGIIFMGGAVGNIWITPVVKELLSNQFLNTPYAIFLLFGFISLIAGSIVCFVIVKNPIPIYEYKDVVIVNNDAANTNKVSIDSVTPIRAAKSIWYKFFVIGFFFLTASIGTIITQAQQTVTNGLLELNNGLNRINSLNVLTTMTILYGVGCLFGNFFGGYLNDKIGIQKSFSLGMLLQLIAALSMLFAPLAPNILPYVWGLCAGLGIYVFTSSSQYMCGYLFGSKEQTKHLGIVSFPYFLGFGSFLLINGSIVGKTGLGPNNDSWLNVHNFLGHQISGLWSVVWIICVVTLLVAFVMILKSLSVMHKMGIDGLANYENTIFQKRLNKKYGFQLWFTKKIIGIFYKNPWESFYWKRVLIKSEKNKLNSTYNELIKTENNLKNEKLIHLLNKEKEKISKYSKKLNYWSSVKIDPKISNYYEYLSEQKLKKLLDKVSKLNTSKLSNIQKYYLNYSINKKILEYKKLHDKKWNEKTEKMNFYMNKINYLQEEFKLSKNKEEIDFQKFKTFYKNRSAYLNNLLISQIELDRNFKLEHKNNHK